MYAYKMHQASFQKVDWSAGWPVSQRSARPSSGSPRAIEKAVKSLDSRRPAWGTPRLIKRQGEMRLVCPLASAFLALSPSPFLGPAPARARPDLPAYPRRSLSRRAPQPTADPPAPCTLINPTTHEIINLNRLSQSTGVDYRAVDEETGDVFLINVCRVVMTEVWGVDDPGSVGIYRQRPGLKGESLGSWNTTLRPHGHSASIVYGRGSPCGSDPRLRMGSIISFECAHDVWNAGQPVFAGTINGCQFFFTWRTPFACGLLVQRSLWHSTLVIGMAVMVIFGVYYILFFAYRRFHLNLRGHDQLPPMPSLAGLGPLASKLVSQLEDVFGRMFDNASRRQARSRTGWTPSTAHGWWEQNHLHHHIRRAGHSSMQNTSASPSDVSLQPSSPMDSAATPKHTNSHTVTTFPTTEEPSPPAIIPTINPIDVHNQQMDNGVDSLNK